MYMECRISDTATLIYRIQRKERENMAEKTVRDRQRKPVNGNDKRIRRTKQNIRNALFQILERKSLDQVTVSEIVRIADINRSTFYFYYENIEDLFRQTEQEIFDLFARDIIATEFRFEKKEEFAAYLTRYLDFCKENDIVCKFVTSNRCNNELADKIREQLQKNIPNSRRIYDETDPRYYLTTFAVSAFLFTILEWMDDGMKIGTEEMARFLTETYVSGSAFVKCMGTDRS